MHPLLEKFLSDKKSLTPAELDELHRFYFSAEGKAEVGRLIDGLSREPLPVCDGGRPDFDALFSRIGQRIRPPRRRRSLPTIAMRVAAAAFIPLLAASVYLLVRSEYPPAQRQNALVVATQEFWNPAGNRSCIVLPDSTRVWLNSGSRLKVQGDFGRGSRKVELSGEAFFDVTKNKRLPFEVNAPGLDIRVKGTRFNVAAYPDSGVTEAVLVEGAIEVTGKDAAAGERLDMKPSQRLRVERQSGDLRITDGVNTEPYTAWKDEKLIFEGTPMAEVMKRLERWFNVTITLEDPALEGYVFTGTFEKLSLERILYFIARSSPITYRIDETSVAVGKKK